MKHSATFDLRQAVELSILGTLKFDEGNPSNQQFIYGGMKESELDALFRKRA